MKRLLILLSFFLNSVVVLAQDADSRAYKTGYSIGKIVGFILIAGLIIWGISKLFKK